MSDKLIQHLLSLIEQIDSDPRITEKTTLIALLSAAIRLRERDLASRQNPGFNPDDTTRTGD